MNTHACDHDGKRFGLGREPCKRTDTAQYSAGCYGSAWLCPDHRPIASRLVDDQLAAEYANGTALAQILKDERAMIAGKAQ